ncbi:hypothetical protein KVF89_22510 [Nocardioides carbamazepini]|uniref:DUF7352 domain-containing protein n=1 Tax=Nocardioides carbamazepini TaxID=2854259 RepID=UPI002149DE21|nr:hypothetical protein [Nocardioides carbamazepini]MCR1785330.1 hypothetical protein [Nocardioides carbamazepini]
MPETETARQVLRWEIPVDGQWHVPPFVGSIVQVAAREAGVVEIWTSPDVGVSHTSDGTGRVLSERITTRPGQLNEREFRVFGTGHPVEGLYHGTALVGPFAWHLFSRHAEVVSR